MGWGGGLSDRVCVDAQFVFKLPERITSEIGVAWHAVEQSAAKAGDNILVIGAGPIGLAILQCLKALDTAQVIVAEVVQDRKDLALHFGATAAIDPTDEDMVSRCKMLCNGQGPDVAFDCAGVATSIKSACLSVRSRGTVVNVAQWGKEIPFNPDNLLVGEKRLITALSYTSEDFERVIDALDKGTIDAEKMITRTISMDRVVEDGILALLHEKDKHIKILVDVRK
ncbi:uncharacterized protein J4E79_004244 [Alternaria viburni]|uniref:uncharacterized protein n=1 Tax=Alternaria viburni TaxID=566460 RepID=UPI0020C43CAC|nr:uncharacterized protein J4E79_004244 [Alternaria viburni]KAI4662932.1 hypothetical protein J4E79_004244 [Alternaria viburni]